MSSRDDEVVNLARRRSFHSSPSTRREPRRKAGSLRVRRRINLDEHEGDNMLPKPPVHIQIANLEESEEEEMHRHNLNLATYTQSQRRRSSVASNSAPISEIQQSRRHSTCTPHQNDSSPEYSPCYSPVSPWQPCAPIPPELWHQHGAGAGTGTGIGTGTGAGASRRRSSAMHQFDAPFQPVPRVNVAMDAFDEYVYKSKHIGAPPPHMIFEQSTLEREEWPLGPQVNIEVPSDSDSSRRPSKASYSATPIPFGPEEEEQNVKESNFSNFVLESRDRKYSTSPIIEQSMLVARPLLDRRCSHTGVVLYPRSAGTSRTQTPLPGNNNMLGVPGRSRGSSLPGTMENLQQEDIYRLRNFSMAGRRVINRGDSLKTRSNHSIYSAGSR